MKRSSAVSYVSLLILFPLLVHASDNIPKEDASVTFSSRTQLVMVPARVTDGSGNFISGLKKDDFVVKENGKAQKVTVFEELTAAPASSIERTAEPPDTFSNRVQEQAPKQLVIFALDTINSSLTDQVAVRKSLRDYLLHQFDPNVAVSLLVIGRGRITVLHDFTSDSKVLIAALRGNKAIGGMETSLMSSWLPDSSVVKSEKSSLPDTGKGGNTMKDALDTASAQNQRMLIEDTLVAMRQIAEAFSGIPGRKSLVWITSGFPLTIADASTFAVNLSNNTATQLRPIGAVDRPGLVDMMPAFQRTWHALNNANVALYPVNARGMVNPFFSGADSASRFMPLQNVDNGREERWARNNDTIGTLKTFAAMTGGVAFFNHNDLRLGFKRAVADSSSYYMLGFYLDKAAKPGWHDLNINVSRPHTHVRARGGLYVNSRDDKQHEGREDVNMALISPLDFTGLPLMARIADRKPIPHSTKTRVNVQLMLPPDASIVEAAANHARLELAIAVNTPTGERYTGSKQTAEAQLTPATVEKIRHFGLTKNFTFDLPPGEYTAHVVARDDLSGRTGSVAVPITIE